MRAPYSARTLHYVRLRSMANMTDVVRIVRLAPPSYNSLTLVVSSSEAEEVYEGIAHIHSATPGGAIIIGEGVQTVATVVISIPYDSDIPEVDDVVLALASDTDDTVVDQAFQIKYVDLGGLLRPVRELSCVAYEANRWWE